MSSLGDWFSNLGTSIVSLGGTIVDGVIGIFVPDVDFIMGKIDYLTVEFSKLGVGSLDMSAMFKGEKALDDITIEIYGQTVTIVRMDIVNRAIQKFRAIIRGFIGLLLILYNYNQFMGLIGQPGITFGAHIRVLHSDRLEDKQR